MPARRTELDALAFREPLARRIGSPPTAGIALFWLGQAGFLIRSPHATLLIDPYLSDSLAEKYRGQRFAHERMMPPPIAPDELGAIDLVLCTHHHTDHMDPGTLAPLARDPATRFVVPATKREEAMRRAGVGPDRLVCADAGDILEPIPGVVIRPIRAAHETLERDAAGRHVFLGYGISLEGLHLVHSGDAVPYDGIEAEFRALDVDLALLPVNGRSALLTANGVPGNFSLDEAITLARDCGIPHAIAHHFDLFAFNTIARATIEREAARPDLGLDLRPATLGIEYRLRLA